MVNTDLVHAVIRSALANSLLATVAAISMLTGTASCAQEPPEQTIDVLLLTGEASIYHDWRKSSPVIRQILEQVPQFNVDLLIGSDDGAFTHAFAGDWSGWDVVVLDYDGQDWPASARESFENYMAAGGGLVLIHAADNAFPDWPAFQEMAGVGGWRGRDESSGPMLRWRDGEPVLDNGPGIASHPPPHDFTIVTRVPDHPVMRGLPEKWLHANDELYSQLRGPASNVTILATAKAEPGLRGATGEHEPMLMTIAYGDGRVFHTTLGHVAPRDEAPVATLNSVGFIVTLQRGTEWAATGRVTQGVPDDFPTADSISLRDLR